MHPPAEKKPYARPELKRFGAVTRLVQGASGLLADGVSGRRRKL
ncbi:hypothetical protein [Smaragdicoccus niigatensis]|nr:hypothetical protein [Smaragdicoccus niigatensis]